VESSRGDYQVIAHIKRRRVPPDHQGRVRVERREEGRVGGAHGQGQQRLELVQLECIAQGLWLKQ
jgi:hypothetical protein